jgi:hypothetical protein
MTPTRYIDHQGREVGVRDARCADTGWMRVYSAWALVGPGHWQRLPWFPERYTPEEAQADLDAYARREGWEVVEP